MKDIVARNATINMVTRDVIARIALFTDEDTVDFLPPLASLCYTSIILGDGEVKMLIAELPELGKLYNVIDVICANAGVFADDTPEVKLIKLTTILDRTTIDLIMKTAY